MTICFRGLTAVLVTCVLILAAGCQHSSTSSKDSGGRSLKAMKSSLPVDPRIKKGVLSNGMRYYIQDHKTPPGKVNIWLHIGSGSADEEENQRGIAHFLEHLAFNGSENFPPGTLIKYFESILLFE